ncbi:hypothetical protein F4827_003518 [Paraburkholderia bannensis]|uniref:Uncharacterized protein n=1 Tax=Paraburkholderia bannensis TaxID=765414 RepID=A0A7W9WUB9_9BURK|nr:MULTISPECIES: hypothetical protein [Paraburkholderia]MBB3258649.1 hypothetical protein [Paraburkholderia sp. WP4_3_2]MBB6103663.1 hypothetical protein [Paraburkholderia bannensis]
MDYGRKRTGISAAVVVMGCSLVAQVAYAITQTKVNSGAGAHNVVAHHVQQPRHPMVMARSYEHRKPEHSRHFEHAKHEERTEHEEHAKHTRVTMAHQRGHRYFHRVRLRKHAVHHGEVEHVQRAQTVQEPWSTQTQVAPTWVLPQVCDQVLNYTGACQPAVLESLRVLGLQVPKVEDRGQMAQHLQSILDRQGLEQVQAQCQSVLLEDQRKINGLQTLLTRAHVVPSDDCSREIQNLTAQAIVAPAPAPSASVATGASDVAQAPVAASGQ